LIYQNSKGYHFIAVVEGKIQTTEQATLRLCWCFSPTNHCPILVGEKHQQGADKKPSLIGHTFFKLLRRNHLI